jgi:type II secretory pathway pseudopilin PulG
MPETLRSRRFVTELSGGCSPGYSLVELMAFMAVMVTLAAFVVPFTRSSVNALNLSGDARQLTSAVSLAKMRAAASFTQARIVVNLGSGTFYVERYQKNPAAWIAEGGVRVLSQTVSFGFAGIATPPPNTQPAIAQAPPCLDVAGATMAGTACIVFNSRGVPIDATNAPVATGAFYIGDGSAVYGVTASTGGMVQLWRTNLVGASWALN